MERVLAGYGTAEAPVRAALGIVPLDFQKLLGPEAWDQLPAAVQHRFGPHAAVGLNTIYDGAMVVEASWFGRLVSQVCRLIGTPLAPWTGAQVPTSVDVHLDRRGGLVWARTYSFKDHAPVLVSSTKLMTAQGDLLEVVRGGLGMALTATVEDGALHFRSRFYFAGLGPLRIRIPDLLTPGRAHVVHRDAGDGAFRFTMDFHHPWLGRTLFQDGLFRDPAPGRPTPPLNGVCFRNGIGPGDASKEKVAVVWGGR